MVLKNLEKEWNALFKWSEVAISSSKCEKLHDIMIELTFEPHLRFLCKKASQLNAITRIACCLKYYQIKIFHVFITFQLSYAQVVWTIHHWKLDNHINCIHERSVKSGYKDHNSTFNEFSANGGSFSIHECNLQKLPIEMFKLKMNLAPKGMNAVCHILLCPEHPHCNVWN